MAELETDYLVVGAGACGMAFTDALIEQADADADVMLVDRRHGPGGHWNDDYPFVRLHQPSAYYGVSSRQLGLDRIDESGPNAGFYERATAAELCDYYSRVLHEQFLPSGRVRFFGMHDYVFDRAGDGAGEGAGRHALRSRVTGETTTVKVRRRLVDATFDGPARATRFTAALARDLEPAGISICAGIHTGEVEVRGDDIGGIAVHVAARIEALAASGEILASRTVKDLTAGSGLHFEDRGTHSLKGLPDDWQLYAVTVP